MKIVLGLFLGFAIGAACRYFKLPAPCPPKLEGAFIVFAITFGYFLMETLFQA